MENTEKCFGILGEVFPVNEQGVREVKPPCTQCSERVDCLKAALATKEGVEMRAKILERAPCEGLISRIQRWSQKKALNRMAQEKEKK